MKQIRSMLCTLSVSALALTGGAERASAQVAPLVIDDFTAGAVTLPVSTTYSWVNQTQTGGASHIVGGVRCVNFTVDDNPFARPAAVDIGDGHLVVDTGIHTNHALMLLYGYDTSCEPVGLNQDMSPYEGLRLDFAGMDMGTAGAIAIWSGEEASTYQLSVAPGERARDVPFADFDPPLTLSDVQYIAIVIESGDVDPAQDYALLSIKALPSLQ
jgi:hypothetical protein